MPLAPFHPTLRAWFEGRFGAPTAAQARAWPLVGAGRHVLVAAPTGSGKTLAAFLAGVDGLLREGAELGDGTRLLYVSPLRALSSDVERNLHGPLAELRELDPDLPQVRVLARTGDTSPSRRAAMRRRPPHILVTTPESLYVLLTSEGGRGMLATVRTVIVDEIHALLGDKRGAHLALSLERLDLCAGREVQRVGLSATQRPIEDVARFLGGVGREVACVDEGHLRELDLAIEAPAAPLATVCSHEQWEVVYRRLSELVREHRTTLLFVQTRKLAERVSAHLRRILGDAAVACHHSSLARERRLEAEQRLKAGELSALVATASLELGIDIGSIDLVCQIGTVPSIATLLQRVGRAGHSLARTPKGRLFPLTTEELVCAAALVRAVRAGELDRTPQPRAPLDILAQQVVAECVALDRDQRQLFEALTRAWPYRALSFEDFCAVLALHAGGPRALLHLDGVRGRVRATRRARLPAVTSGGAIPDTADYPVVLDPEGTVVGTVHEDFAVEASGGDVFQLGNASWRVLGIQGGKLRVADAQGAPPSLPFWLGEAPARTRELSREVGAVRERALEPGCLAREPGLPQALAREIEEHVAEGARVLGCVPTPSRVVFERFFDESGGTQLVVHACFGGRVNRALGFALRKRFCRRFGFELQAAAGEDAIVLSLGPQHAFPLEEVPDYLRSGTVAELLRQAVLPTPMFAARWRWNVGRALLVPRFQGGRRVPAPLLRMRAEDELARAFPDALACGENLPAGDLSIPLEHPLVRQTLEDCLSEAMDVEGLRAVLEGMRSGAIEVVLRDTPEPSAFARAVLAIRPYGFLDDAPLEERRTQAVARRRVLDPRTADTLGQLDPEAVERVREEAWPRPTSAEEVHEALSWMGYATDAEAEAWAAWLAELRAQGRVSLEQGRWLASEAPRDAASLWAGRLAALGPLETDDPALLELEARGQVLRVRLGGRPAWCDRRLLARIHRYTLETLRSKIRPVAPAAFLRFLAHWQYLAPDARLEGPGGVAQVVRRLAGFEAPAAAFERELVAPRVEGYRPEWLDQLAFEGFLAWGRLWGSSRVAPPSAPICLFPREDARLWTGLAGVAERGSLTWPAAAALAVLERDGASFTQDLERGAGLLPSDLERGLRELVSAGLATADSFASLRQLLLPASRRGRALRPPGRWSAFRLAVPAPPPADQVARRLLERYGVLFRRLLERERLPVPWRDLVRELRTLELRGEVRGGRFVDAVGGEQFALAEAIPALRSAAAAGGSGPLEVASTDPLNLAGILTPQARVTAAARRRVVVLGAAS